ncbi:MAG: ABC transporter ATP-binding protein/permease [Clostridia bacterium]|nr:ABC transporter ATP-binding protein/permease [Clostridia bacterium]
MLKLIDVKKEYYAGGETVQALKGVSLNFRRNEFVSILGASGCGKTTLLNIIGGLDKYNSGDLIIDGKSTKEYGDRDWDTYRNHSIGFIFQSYHLIPHQTILQNVELALMISGVSKEERRQRAVEALEKVGLKDKLNNRPNQLSGGQAQRVAIARALINDPEIVLADEPTGALDSKTSVQIMELLKEISNDRLVIMVTHNPELAEQYSTRIIRLLDGQVTDDSKPYSDAEEAAEVKAAAEAKEAAKKAEQEEEEKLLEQEAAEGGKVKRKKVRREKKKASMPITMAFGLSLKNLLSKRKRTAMVSIAGSIGIIGVSMVLAISAGVKSYIRDMENDMLSGYPIAIEQTAFDWSAITNISATLDKKPDITKLKDKVYVDSLLQTMLDMGNNFIAQNNLSETYLDFVSSMPKEYYNAMQFAYAFDINNYLYTDFKVISDNSPSKVDLPLPEDKDSSSEGISLTALRSMYKSILEQEEEYKHYASLMDNFTGLKEIPDNPDYILSQYDVVATNGNMTELQIKEALQTKENLILVLEDGSVDDLDLAQFAYFSQEELLNYAFKAADNGHYDPNIGMIGSGGKDDPLYDESTGSGGLNYNYFYDKTFKFYPNDTIFTRTDNVSDPNQPFFTYNSYSDGFAEEGSFDLGIKVILQKKSNVNYGCIDGGLYYTNALTKHILEQGAASQIAQFLAATPGNMLKEMPYTYDYTYYKFTDGVRSYYKDTATDKFSQSAGMLAMMGGGVSYYVTNAMVAGSDLATAVGIYPVDFDAKNKVTQYLDGWNDLCKSGGEYKGVTLEEKDVVKYTDTVGMIISMIDSMIEMITIALVAFTALSLVVSTVMVGIITYVSVVERIKEIGILRSVGARKKDIKRLFNAETFMIGLVAGLFGIIVTYILSLIINLVVASLAPITTLAALPWWQAIIMVAVSVVLTLISGLIPAAAAAKKDPVVALRTE